MTKRLSFSGFFKTMHTYFTSRIIGSRAFYLKKKKTLPLKGKLKGCGVNVY